MTDEKTAAALAARSERAVADVIARYSRHLYTVAAAALRGVGTEQDAEEAAAEQARQTAHRKLLLRIGGVGIFSILVIALAVVLIRKLHKAGKC